MLKIVLFINNVVVNNNKYIGGIAGTKYGNNNVSKCTYIVTIINEFVYSLRQFKDLCTK